MAMPSQAELLEERKELRQEVARLKAGGGSRRAFVEAVVAAAIARDGARVLDPQRFSGSVAEPRAIKAIRRAEACVRLGLEMLEDDMVIDSMVEEARAT